MGTNTNIYLPLDVNVELAAKAIGVMLGLPTKFREVRPRSMGPNSTYWESDVRGIRYRRMGSIASHATVEFLFRHPDKKKSLTSGYEAESAYFTLAERCYPKIGGENFWNVVGCISSTPFWCALAKNLVDFFGGYAHFEDTDDPKGKNVYRGRRRCPADRAGLIPDDGSAWSRFHEALTKLTPPTPKEIKAARGVAHYAYAFEKDGITPKKEASA